MSHPLIEEYEQLKKGETNGVSEDSRILYKITAPTDPQEVDVDKAWNSLEDRIKIIPIQKPSGYFYLLRVAAIVLILGAIGSFYFFNTSNSEDLQFISINADQGVELVTLPDNSKVWLRSGSTIFYKSDFNQDRSLTLKGTAYFEVMKGEVPFNVDASNLEVTVLGTEFLVSCEDEITSSVAVSEGLVAVSTEQEKTKVAAGSTSFINNETGKILLEDQMDPNALSWKTGKFVFDNTQLEKAIDYLNAYYDERIEIKNNIKSCKVSGSFDKLPIQKVVEEISIVLSLNISKEGETYVLSGKGC